MVSRVQRDITSFSCHWLYSWVRRMALWRSQRVDGLAAPHTLESRKRYLIVRQGGKVSWRTSWSFHRTSGRRISKEHIARKTLPLPQPLLVGRGHFGTGQSMRASAYLPTVTLPSTDHFRSFRSLRFLGLGCARYFKEAFPSEFTIHLSWVSTASLHWSGVSLKIVIKIRSWFDINLRDYPLGSVKDRQVPPKSRLIAVHQAWLWHFDGHIITAFPKKGG